MRGAATGSWPGRRRRGGDPADCLRTWVAQREAQERQERVAKTLGRGVAQAIDSDTSRKESTMTTPVIAMPDMLDAEIEQQYGKPIGELQVFLIPDNGMFQ